MDRPASATDRPASATGGSATPATDPRSTYTERVARFDENAAVADRAVRSYGRLRLAVFAAGVAGTWLLFPTGRSIAAWAVVAGAATTFGFLVAGQRRARGRRRRAELAADANRRGVARLDRCWDDLLPLGEEASADEHDYADDLDVRGRASLLRLLHAGGTPLGQATLRGWLLSGGDAQSTLRRQEAVTELAGALDFRDGLTAEAASATEARAKRSGAAQVPPELRKQEVLADEETRRFLRWAEGDAWLPGRRWLLVAAFILPPINATALALYFLGAMPSAVVAWPLLVSLAVLWPCWKGFARAFSEAEDGESGVRHYGPVLAYLSSRGSRFDSRCLAEIVKRLDGEVEHPRGSAEARHARPRAAPAGPAHREIERLRRLLDMADLRRSPLFHLPLALLLFWDVHVLAALERWKARSGHQVREWLGAMGETEALAALAALAADHPDWTMPTLDDQADTVRGRSLGHPLLPPDACVRNDVELGPPGSFLLVTGSNMSGKSTLLKAVGLNVVLARAGAPVCAEFLRLPPLRVVTSMSVRDSLADGVSYFMAELARLKKVVDAAEALDAAETPDAPEAQNAPSASSDADAGGHASPRTLYLLDEILQGTNSAERQIAARTILRRLLASGAVGAVTTHDLALADAEDLTARAVAVHFTESVADAGQGAEKLVFDYRLRPGIATSTNALRLLGLVGLDRPQRDSSRKVSDSNASD